MAFKPLGFKVPGQFEYQGILYGGTMQVDIQMNDTWIADPSDVLIASYPRTGTTWMGALLPLIMTEGDEEKVKGMGTHLSRVPYVEIAMPGSQSALDKMSTRMSPHLMKSHLRYDFFQKRIENDKLKVILMIRNPKDCLTSFYHFYKDMFFMGHFPGTFHDFFDMVKANKTVYGSYWDWYANWWVQKDRENILVVRYEDMVKDCIGIVQKVASFLHKTIDYQTVEKIVRLCSKDNMRKDMSPEQLFQIQEGDNAELKFIRKGGIGGWKNTLNDEESSMIDSWCKDKLRPLGLHFENE